jgi:hypothetical protein
VRVIAQSVTPRGLLVRCADCGHATLASMPSGVDAADSQPDAPADIDKRRIERLVNRVIADRRLACRLVSVDRSRSGWRVAVRTRSAGPVGFEVAGDSLSVVQAAIEHALETERS